MAVGQQPVTSTTVETTGPKPIATTNRPGGNELARRVVVFLFGIVQGLILLRILFLVLNAREANGLVSGILNLSQVFVGPFEGIFHTNALQAGGSLLDITAIAALIGWTILEAIVIAAIGIFRREAA